MARTKSGSTATISRPQFFMEGVDARIRTYPFGGYYDCMTEDYEGQVGNILSYDEWDDQEQCWIVTMRMSDGETLEVLESELDNFKRPSVAAKVADPGLSHAYRPSGQMLPVVDYVNVVKSVNSGPTKAPAPTKAPVKFDNMIKVFDLTPKKRKRQSIFKSQ